MTEQYEGRLRRKDWIVRPVSLEVARLLVQKYHYAHGGSNTATYLHGLFPRSALFDMECRGICWWIPPTKSAAKATYPKNWQGVLSLSRMVIIPGTPLNAASFLLTRSMKYIDRKRWPCLVTYADEWQGHTGTIYKITGWEYAGKTKPEPIYVKDGRVIARKAGPKTRTHQEMLDLGAELVGKFSKHKFIHIKE